MTVRAFTHGYDLFHPATTIVWHDYIRADAKKHWGDHVDTTTVARVWSDLDTVSRNKVLRLVRGEAVENYGLGSERTIADYEAYAGLSFQKRRAQTYTMRDQPPPNPPAPPNWTDSIYPWIAKCTVRPDELPSGSVDDPLLWAASVYDGGGFEIYRRDFSSTELKELQGRNEDVHVVMEFNSETAPASWAISPLSRSRGWLAKVTGQFHDGDFAQLDENDTEDA